MSVVSCLLFGVCCCALLLSVDVLWFVVLLLVADCVLFVVCCCWFSIV